MTNRETGSKREPSINFNYTEEGKRQLLEATQPKTIQKRNCTHCIKFDTCLIWRILATACEQINKQLEGTESKQLDATNWATNCDQYMDLPSAIGR
jgi:hypothetical protein